jgi:hypothetical protein
MDANEMARMQWERRLRRLERERWVWRGMAGAAVVAAGIMLVTGAGGSDKGSMGQFRQVDAQRIVLRDNDGQMRAWLGVAEGGSRLIFMDASGQERMGVGMTRQSEPALGIYDGGDNPRVILGMMEGWPGFVFRDPQGHKRVAIFCREDWSSLYFYDRTETRRTGVGQYGEASALNLCDDRGKDRIGLVTDRKGSSLSLMDIAGVKRVALGTLREDEPALGFFDDMGEPQISLAALWADTGLKLYGTNRMEIAVSINKTNGPRVEIFGGGHKSLWQAP